LVVTDLQIGEAELHGERPRGGVGKHDDVLLPGEGSLERLDETAVGVLHPLGRALNHRPEGFPGRGRLVADLGLLQLLRGTPGDGVGVEAFFQRAGDGEREGGAAADLLGATLVWNCTSLAVGGSSLFGGAAWLPGCGAAALFSRANGSPLSGSAAWFCVANGSAPSGGAPRTPLRPPASTARARLATRITAPVRQMCRRGYMPLTLRTSVPR